MNGLSITLDCSGASVQSPRAWLWQYKSAYTRRTRPSRASRSHHVAVRARAWLERLNDVIGIGWFDLRSAKCGRWVGEHDELDDTCQSWEFKTVWEWAQELNNLENTAAFPCSFTVLKTHRIALLFIESELHIKGERAWWRDL